MLHCHARYPPSRCRWQSSRAHWSHSPDLDRPHETHWRNVRHPTVAAPARPSCRWLFAPSLRFGPGDNSCKHRHCRCRSEEHTSELQSLMRISYAVFCLKKKKNLTHNDINITIKQQSNKRTRINQTTPTSH